jgi:hypothetical protein
MFMKQDDTVATSTSSTTIMTSTNSEAILTTTTSTATTISSSSTSSTSLPEMNTVSDKSTDVMLVFWHTAIDVSHLHLSILTVAFQSDPPAVSSGWKKQGPAIVGDGVDDGFGRSVALSADASTLVIGASDLYFADAGYYVKVYRIDGDGGNWVQIGQTLSSNATEDYFGYSVDISADGMTIICGSSGEYGV